MVGRFLLFHAQAGYYYLIRLRSGKVRRFMVMVMMMCCCVVRRWWW